MDSAGTQTHTVLATANVLRTLGPGDAADALAIVLAERPDLIGLQEWGVTRRGLLHRHRAYGWFSPAYGGCAMGARTDRYDLIGSRMRVLGWSGRAELGVRPVPILPPRVATVTVLRDRLLGRRVSVIVYHLVPAVQAHGVYRTDRPLLVARHRLEHRRLSGLVQQQAGLGCVVHAMGDSNFDGLGLPGLTSAWQGQPDAPGTLGRRRVDDIFGPGPAETVSVLETPSDHRAVVVRRLDR